MTKPRVKKTTPLREKDKDIRDILTYIITTPKSDLYLLTGVMKQSDIDFVLNEPSRAINLLNKLPNDDVLEMKINIQAVLKKPQFVVRDGRETGFGDTLKQANDDFFAKRGGTIHTIQDMTFEEWLDEKQKGERK
jgi:hypothetical protein